MIRLYAAFLLILAVSCSPTTETVSAAPPSASNTYPVNRDSDKDSIQEFQKVKDFRDLFEIEKVIEIDSTMVLAEVFRSVVHPKGYLVVIDSIQHRIIVFDMKGQYVRDIGKKGQGPGEYAEPLGISLGFDDSIIVRDNGARVHAFAIDGSHLASTGFGGGVRQTFGGVALWPKKHQVILAGIDSVKKTDPLHMVIDHSTDTPQVQHKFGHRFFSSHLDGHFHDLFTVIEGVIWYHSPYTSYIEFFDLEGHYLGSSSPLTGAKRVQMAELMALEPLTKEALKTYLRDRSTPFGFYQFEDLVISDFLLKFDLYSSGGALLAQDIGRKKVGQILGQYNGRLLTRMGAIENFERYADDLKAHLMDLSNGDKEKLIDSNGFIIFWRKR